jgi:flavin-dependent dehydrogenase
VVYSSAGVSVTDVRNLSAAVEVVTSAGVFKSSFLAGADGAHSIVARKAGIKRQHDYIIGINNEIEISAVDLNAWRSCIRADIGCIRGGYGWVFPKRDHLSIGIASLARINACGLRQAYDLYEKSLCLISHSIRKRSGHIIPVIKRDQILFAGRIVLTGDAAGLADPLTGEGIYSAVLSGQLASAAFEAALHYGKEKLAQYQSAVAGSIFPELKIARVLRSLFVRFPSSVFKILKSEEILWRGGCRLARGEIDYALARQRSGGYKQIYGYLIAALRG